MKQHVRLFVSVFGFKYCIKGLDLPAADIPPLVAAVAVISAKFPALTIEVTDHA